MNLKYLSLFLILFISGCSNHIDKTEINLNSEINSFLEKNISNDSSGSIFIQILNNSNYELGEKIIETKDRKLLVISNVGKNENSNINLIKFNNEGNELWRKEIVGSKQDSVKDIIELNNGDFILAGNSKSFIGENPNYDNNIILIKFNKDGDELWAKIIHLGYDYISGIVKLDNDDFIISGNSKIGKDNYLIVTKFNTEGKKKWFKTFKMNGDKSKSTALTILNDNSLILLGDIYNKNYSDDYNSFLVKFSEGGVVEWTKIIDFDSNALTSDISGTKDGGFIFTGVNEKSEITKGDIFVVKFTQSGDLDWNKKIDFKFNDIVSKIIELKKGGYILSGRSYDYTGLSYEDLVLIKVSEEGIIDWFKIMNNTGNGDLRNVKELNNSELIFIGDTNAYGGYNRSIILINLDNNGNCDDCDYIKPIKISPKNEDLIIFDYFLEESSLEEDQYFINISEVSINISNKSFFLIND